MADGLAIILVQFGRRFKKRDLATSERIEIHCHLAMIFLSLEVLQVGSFAKRIPVLIRRYRPIINAVGLVGTSLIALSGCGDPGEPAPHPSAEPQTTTQQPVVTSQQQDEGAIVQQESEPLPADPARLREASLAALESGDEDAAFRYARQAISLAPDDSQIIYLMALLLGERNRFPEAIRMLDQLAEAVPSTRIAALGQTADWMVVAGQWTEAENRYRTIMKEIPGAVLVHRKLARLLIRQGRRSEAAEHLRQLCRAGDIEEIELRSLLTTSWPFAGDALKEIFEPIGALGTARHEISQGNWSTATDELRRAKSNQPETSALLGRCYAQQQDYPALGQWAETAPESGRATADYWVAMGVFSAHQGDPKQAVNCLAKAVLRDPTDKQAYRLMSQLLKKLGAAQQAATAEERAEWIEQTQLLGKEMAESNVRDGMKMSKLIDLLQQLHRPLEALAWKTVLVGYGKANSRLSESDAQKLLDEIAGDRAAQMKSNETGPSRQFILCGVEIDSEGPDDASDRDSHRQQ